MSYRHYHKHTKIYIWKGAHYIFIHKLVEEAEFPREYAKKT